MAVLGLASVEGVDYADDTTFDVHVKLIIFDNSGSVTNFTTNVTKGGLLSAFNTQVINAAKAKMISDYGFTFTPIVDTVQLVGA